MSENGQPEPPNFPLLLGQAAEDRIDLAVLARGVYEAETEIARAAALTLANGLYPASLCGMLVKLKALREAVLEARSPKVQYPPFKSFDICNACADGNHDKCDGGRPSRPCKCTVGHAQGAV